MRMGINPPQKISMPAYGGHSIPVTSRQYYTFARRQPKLVLALDAGLPRLQAKRPAKPAASQFAPRYKTFPAEPERPQNPSGSVAAVAAVEVVAGKNTSSQSKPSPLPLLSEVAYAGFVPSKAGQTNPVSINSRVPSFFHKRTTPVVVTSSPAHICQTLPHNPT